LLEELGQSIGLPATRARRNDVDSAHVSSSKTRPQSAENSQNPHGGARTICPSRHSGSVTTLPSASGLPGASRLPSAITSKAFRTEASNAAHVAAASGASSEPSIHVAPLRASHFESLRMK